MGSKRQDICTKIGAALAAILTDNDYLTNLGQNVFEWRSTPLEDSELPGIIWRDRGNVYEGPVTGRTSNELTIELEIFFTGSTSPAKMRNYIADIRTCLMNNNTWSNLAIGTSLIEDETSTIEQAELKIGATSMRFSIKYITSLSDF